MTRYAIDHETRYRYDAPVSQSWQIARLTPRPLPWQRLLSHALQIDPPPDERHDGPDGFGNTTTHFALHGAHRMLRVRMQARLDVVPRPVLRSGLAWEAVRDAAAGVPADAEALLAAQMREPTRLVPLSEAVAAYAAESFEPGRPWLEALDHFTSRIHADFRFEPGATTVATSIDEVLRGRHGVCQDFAHLMQGALRAMGLPARYVSGYLLTDPPPGQPRLHGVDASHAWVAAWAPGLGWVEFDPTNDQRADERYITLAWGGDFADVAPLAGVILGGGTQTMDVQVTVQPA
jgi:transglutaminase-like putative cysteine protease